MPRSTIINRKTLFSNFKSTACMASLRSPLLGIKHTWFSCKVLRLPLITAHVRGQSAFKTQQRNSLEQPISESRRGNKSSLGFAPLLSADQQWDLCPTEHPRPAAPLSASFKITYRRHGPGLNRRVSICSQYDGGLAHSRPVACGVVLLCSSPERVGIVSGPAAGGTGWILPEGRIDGRGSGRRRRGVFKRPIRFATVQFSRFIFRGTKTFAVIARWVRRRVMERGGRGARCRAVRLACCKSRSTVGLLHRDVAAGSAGRLFGHVSLIRRILKHEWQIRKTKGNVEAWRCCSPSPLRRWECSTFSAPQRFSAAFFSGCSVLQFSV